MRRRLDGAGWLALAVLAVLPVACAAAPLVEAALGVDAQAVNLLAAARPPGGDGGVLGTDELGRDLLVRLLYGGRVSLLVGVVGALAAGVLGTAIGLAAGMAGGRLDAVLMRMTDGVIALPLLPLLVLAAAADPARLGIPDGAAGAVARVAILVALVGWTTTARLARAAVLSVRARDFVRAAEALGASPWRIAWRHVLPNAASPVIVAATLSVGAVILLEAALGFLGLGVQPPTPSWGNMLTGALETVWTAPWLALWPGVAVFVTVAAVNRLGEGLRAGLDPRAG